MDQSPDLLADLPYLDRRIRVVRRHMLPGQWKLYGLAAICGAGGFALGGLLKMITGSPGAVIVPVLVGVLAALLILKVASDRWTALVPWKRGEPLLAVLLDRCPPPDQDTDGVSMAVLLVNASRDVARDADEMLDLRDQVLTWIDSLHPDIAGDRATWLLCVPFDASTDLPPTGDDGVLLIPVLRARPKKNDARDRIQDAAEAAWAFSSPIRYAALKKMGAFDRAANPATKRSPYPRVRPIPARFWNEKLAADARLPG